MASLLLLEASNSLTEIIHAQNSRRAEYPPSACSNARLRPGLGGRHGGRQGSSAAAGAAVHRELRPPEVMLQLCGKVAGKHMFINYAGSSGSSLFSGVELPYSEATWTRGLILVMSDNLRQAKT